MRRRILVTIAVFAFVGAMINVAVAWVLGARGGVREMASYQVSIRHEGAILPVTWLCRRAEAFGLDHVAFVGGGAFGIGQGRTPSADERLRGWPRWARMPETEGPAARTTVLFVAAGWPARSLVARCVDESAAWPVASRGAFGDGLSNLRALDPTARPPAWAHAYVVEEQGAGGPFSARVLPAAPIAVGFAANTAFWGAGAYALFALAVAGGRWGRGRTRRRAGRCPSCDYDLHGETAAGCPECGWKRCRV